MSKGLRSRTATPCDREIGPQRDPRRTPCSPHHRSPTGPTCCSEILGDRRSGISASSPCPSESLSGVEAGEETGPAVCKAFELFQATRELDSLKVNEIRGRVEIRAIPDPDHTQEITSSCPVAPSLPPGEGLRLLPFLQHRFHPGPIELLPPLANVLVKRSRHSGLRER
jgi:hypothetical protein